MATQIDQTEQDTGRACSFCGGKIVIIKRLDVEATRKQPPRRILGGSGWDQPQIYTTVKKCKVCGLVYD